MGLRSVHGHTPAALKRTPPPPLRHKLICPGCNRRFFGLRSDAVYLLHHLPNARAPESIGEGGKMTAAERMRLMRERKRTGVVPLTIEVQSIGASRCRICVVNVRFRG